MSQVAIEVSEKGAPFLSDFLLGLGSEGVAEDLTGNGMCRVSSYFRMDADLTYIISELRQYCSFLKDNVPGVNFGAITAEHIDSSSWEVWRTQLKKVRAGKRVVIRPPWEEHMPENDEIVIEINPSLAFGTGHHETTRLCIRSIEELSGGGGVGSMLDVGCGSGILSIAARKLGIKNVTGFDTDPVAIQESIKNAEKNSVRDGIKFFCGDIRSVIGEYDLIVANLYLEPIYLMREEFKSRLAEGGRLVLSGIPEIRRDEAVESFSRAGFMLDEELSEGDWVALHYTVR